MSKAYDAKSVEDDIYAAWEKSGYFTPENLPNAESRTEPFTIVLPPPNVTGTLHMGHAVMLAIEDALVRYHRMDGKKALWIPGTDHAAIATEAKVEKIMIDEEGKTKRDIGREAFLKKVEQFAQDSHDTITNQVKKMGASVDWTREAYTLDDARNIGVRTAFKKMYDDGLIYRGYRVINWSVKGQSTCSDDELVYVERPGKLYTFKYSKDIPIVIATTRPETKLGDTAIAVHPEGKWKEYIGQTFTVENFGQTGHELTLKVFGDENVDDDFGTGALGVTTAHSPIDFEMYQKQKAAGNDIGLIQVIGEDGKMTSEAGYEYEGLTVKEARKKVVQWLSDSGLLEDTEEITQSVGTSDRFKDVVEALPKTQWFVDVNKEFEQDGKRTTLKRLMQEAVRGGAIEILPDRFNKTYFHWIDNLRDWNISRQIWFGHRIPAWYRSTDAHGRQGEEMYVGVDAPEGEGWEQDPDTLDTWFSAGLWTFSTLGWPEKTDDLAFYHPTSVLETGYDILFFWVARMILMSTYLLGEVPFKTVYLHGLVRDEKGRKMSKSLENIIDPLDMIAEYGADATRLSLLIGSSPGNDMKLSVEKIASFRNFTNKLWNIARFVLSNVENVEVVEDVEAKTLADKWILAKFSQVSKEVTEHLEKYELSLAGEKLRAFTWSDFADWYLEMSKVEKNEDMLLYILERLLKLWHPFMPFVTEEIYKSFGGGMLIVAEWPKVDFETQADEMKSFEQLQEVVTAIRNIRATYSVPPSKKMSATITGGAALKEMSDVIMALARLDHLDFNDAAEKPHASASAVVGEMNIYIPLEGIVDLDKERARLEKDMKDVESYVNSLTRKLANKQFVENAPEEIVAAEKERLQEATARLENLKKEIEGIE